MSYKKGSLNNFIKPLLLSLSFFLMAGLLFTTSSCSFSQTDIDNNRRIAVEQNLMPAYSHTNRIEGWDIHDRMQRYNIPGVSITVIHNGKIDWTQGYGYTRPNGTEVGDSTIFQAASLSKPITAAIALSMANKKLIELDEDVNEYLRSWKLTNETGTESDGVTVRSLLSHSAGINIAGFSGYKPNADIPTLLQILNGEYPSSSPKIISERKNIGEYRYSGGGYQVIQMILEDVSGDTFEDIAQRVLFKPLNMTNSSLNPFPSVQQTDRIANGHHYDGTTMAEGWHIYPQVAAAALWSTPEDIARFLIEIMNAYSAKSDSLLSTDIIKEMLSPNVGSMGLGVGIHDRGQNMHIDHSGWNDGYRSYFIAYPELGEGLVVMTNGDGGNLLIDEIRRSVSFVYNWPHFKTETRKTVDSTASLPNDISGIYTVSDEFTLELIAKNNHFILNTPRGSFYTFYNDSGNAFRAIEDGSEVLLSKNELGKYELYIWGMKAVQN